MKQVILNVPDKDYPFFMELVKKLPFIKPVSSPAKNTAKNKVLSDLQESIVELKQIKAGKKKGIAARDLLNEL